MSELRSVWHYTTAEGLRGIVEGGVLWATSHRFMNDSEEAEFATNTLRKTADSIRSGVPDHSKSRFDNLMRFADRKQLEVFLLCAARKPDLLTVWRGYGASVPYAVELDATLPLLPVEQVKGRVHPSPPAGHKRETDTDDEGSEFTVLDPDQVHIDSTDWAAVSYDAADSTQRVQRMADLAVRAPQNVTDEMLPYLNLGGIDLLQLKHSAFEDEREARMVFDVHPRWKFVKHRTTRFGLTPYIEVSSADEDNHRAANERFVTKPANRLPIRSVHIGPSPLGDESKTALTEFLELNGYPDIKVEKSEIPFR